MATTPDTTSAARDAGHTIIHDLLAKNPTLRFAVAANGSGIGIFVGDQNRFVAIIEKSIMGGWVNTNGQECLVNGKALDRDWQEVGLVADNPKGLRFVRSTIGTVHQSGEELTARQVGVNVVVRYREGELIPCSAEVYDDACVEYADLGLEWEGDTLTGYDGAFDLPREVLTVLQYLGHRVSADLLED